MAEFEKSQFCIDSIDGIKFTGYSDGDTWNGFACPYFEQQVAEQILNASASNGYLWSYDPEQDMYLVRSKDDPEDYAAEEFEGQEIIFAGDKIKVYGIGAYSWIWDLCSE